MYGRRRDGSDYLKREAREWMDELGWSIKVMHVEEWPLPLEVRCSGTFRSKREAPDLSNLSKVTLDAIQEVTGLNDRGFRWHDGQRLIIKNAEPVLTITIKEGEGNDQG
jgi:hypothetical protein